jgi:hypothetical protein
MIKIILISISMSFKVNCQVLPYIFTNKLKKDNPICFSDSAMSESCQDIASQLSFIGNHKDALISYAHGFGVRKNITTKGDSDVVKNFYLSSALKYIVNNLESQKIVMINEGHHIPAHRNFTKQLLDELYQKGYRYLGCEGFSKSDSNLMQRGFCNYNSGYYIKEPQYSNMINYAINMGFKIFAYDYGNFSNREKTQAENIIRILKQDSTAKIVVHAGWGHIREDTLQKAMAYWVKRLSHINPFTINQARMMEQKDTYYENSTYQCIRENLTEPSILLNKKNNTLYNSNDSLTDIIVFHPKTEIRNGRPIWMFKDKKMLEKNILLDKIKTPILVVVVDTNKPGSIPVDIIEVNNPTKNITVFIPYHGNFSIIGYDENYKIVYKKNLKK